MNEKLEKALMWSRDTCSNACSQDSALGMGKTLGDEVLRLQGELCAFGVALKQKDAALRTIAERVRVNECGRGGPATQQVRILTAEMDNIKKLCVRALSLPKSKAQRIAEALMRLFVTLRDERRINVEVALTCQGTRAHEGVGRNLSARRRTEAVMEAVERVLNVKRG